MMFGSSELEKFIMHYSSKGYLQISFLNDNNKLSWGPISLFTWNFYQIYVNHELRKEESRQIIIKIFNSTEYHKFDEWGNYQNSFSRVLHDIFY